MNMKAWSVIFTILFSLTTVASADDAADARLFVQTQLDAVVAVLQTPATDREQRKEAVTDIIMPCFDLPLMAKLAAGKGFWSRFSAEQRQRYSHAFEHRLQKLYIDKIMLYTDQKIAYQTPLLKGRNKCDVPTELITDSEAYSMIYKLYRSDGRWRIYDVEIEAVSVLKSFRAQITQVLNSGSFEDLMDRMEDAADTQ